MTDSTLIEFPADIAVKAMGLNAADFEALVTSLVIPLIEPAPASISTLPSKQGKYLSVRVQFTATSHAQLQRVYVALHAESRVLYTL